MKEKNYLSIIAHYESCLEQHGDTHLGVDWPKAEDVATRHRVMLDLIRPDPTAEKRKISLLDFGCGASHLYEHIRDRNLDRIDYVGLDLSEKFVSLSRSKFPDRDYLCMDVMSKHVDWEREDLFHLPFDTMAALVQTLTKNFVIRNDYGLYEYTVYMYR